MDEKEFIAAVTKTITDYRDLLSFQDRLFLSIKFGQKGILSNNDVLRELKKKDFTLGNLCYPLANVDSAVESLVSALSIQGKWLLEKKRDLTDGDRTRTSVIISWINDQRTNITNILSYLYTLIDEEKKADEIARTESYKD